MTKVFWAVLLLIGLSACTTTSSIKKDFVLQGEERGIAVFSVSHDNKHGTHLTNANFHLSAKGYDSAADKVFLPGKVAESDFQRVNGTLFVVDLPAGSHTLSGWQVTSGAAIRLTPKETPPPLEFQIAGGEVAYLGNWHMNLRMGKTFLGVTVVSDAYPEIKDEELRDISLFEQRYPQFSGKAVKSIPMLGVWLKKP